MSTNYATERVTAAIQEYLMNLDVIPPAKESARLATEITEVVWAELGHAGLSREILENYFAANAKTMAQGQV